MSAINQMMVITLLWVSGILTAVGLLRPDIVGWVIRGVGAVLLVAGTGLAQRLVEVRA